MRKTRLFPVIGLLLILFSIVGITSGCSSNNENISVPEIKKDVFVYDQDNIIDDETEKALNSMLVDLEEKTEVEFVVISVTSLNGYSIEEYSNEVFNKLGIGKKDDDNGLLLLFSRSDKKVRIEVGRGLEGILNDSKCGRILDDYFVPYRDKDKYTKATKLTTEELLNVISDEYNVSIKGLTNNDKNDNDNKDFNLQGLLQIIGIIALIIILIIIISFGIGSRYSGGHHFGKGGGHSGGYHFGCSHSSGSVSFGGGFSGGGGASR